jgi:predicted kinase
MRQYLARPTLVSITGFAGSGKTTISTEISKYFHIPRLEVDHIRQTIRECDEYTGSEGASTGLTKEIIFELTRSFLACGVSLVLDMHMWHIRDWNRLQQIITESGEIDVYKFILHCPYEICAERVEARRRQYPNHVFGKHNLDEHKFKWDSLYAFNVPDAITIDATKSSVDVLHAILQHIATSEITRLKNQL